jgi:hypothetical protein
MNRHWGLGSHCALDTKVREQSPVAGHGLAQEWPELW